jgi:hypothetical protein
MNSREKLEFQQTSDIQVLRFAEVERVSASRIITIINHNDHRAARRILFALYYTRL